jgi:hypothetical protein
MITNFVPLRGNCVLQKMTVNRFDGEHGLGEILWDTVSIFGPLRAA